MNSKVCLFVFSWVKCAYTGSNRVELLSIFYLLHECKHKCKFCERLPLQHLMGGSSFFTRWQISQSFTDPISPQIFCVDYQNECIFSNILYLSRVRFAFVPLNLANAWVHQHILTHPYNIYFQLLLGNHAPLIQCWYEATCLCRCLGPSLGLQALSSDSDDLIMEPLKM